MSPLETQETAIEINCKFSIMLHNIIIDSWHNAGTYDAKTKTGGPNGSIRNQEELKHNANAGLENAVKFCGELLLLYGF